MATNTPVPPNKGFFQRTGLADLAKLPVRAFTEPQTLPKPVARPPEDPAALEERLKVWDYTPPGAQSTAGKALDKLTSAYGAMPAWARYGIPVGAGALGGIALQRAMRPRKKEEKEAAVKLAAAYAVSRLLG